MDFTNILNKISFPTVEVYAIELDDSKKWELYQFVAKDMKDTTYLLDMWLTYRETLFKSSSHTQLDKIYAGLKMYKERSLKHGHATDYFIPVHREEKGKLYESLLCKFLPTELGDIYIPILDVATMVTKWNAAMQYKKTIYMLESMKIASVKYSQDSRIASPSSIKNFGKSYDALTNLSAPDDVKELVNNIFLSDDGQKIIEQYQKLATKHS